MLFHYAVEATEENWLHDSICAILSAGMDQIDVGREPACWPDCLPEEHRDRLSSRTGIRDHSQKFFDKYTGYDIENRQRIRNALSTQNALPDIFNGQSDRVTLDQMPEDIRDAIRELFRYAFGLLTEVGLRDRHYEAIYRELSRKFCPFCGLERLSAPGQPRHDLDHYLLFSVYPFAGANLRNLVPMGDRCNKSFKREIDVIFDPDTSTRRRCCDPYSGSRIALELTQTKLLSEDRAIRPQPNWSLTFTGADSDRIATWDATFQIQERYTDVLDDEFASWLRGFAAWSGHPMSTASINDVQSAVAALSNYIELIDIQGLDDSNFLKKAVFGLLRDHCRNGPDAEIIAHWLQTLVDEFSFEEVA